MRFIAAFALMLLYAAGSTQTGFLHELFHPDEITAIHTPKHEENPCHRSLFHGLDTGCDHEFHIVKVSSCGLTHTVGQGHFILAFGQPDACEVPTSLHETATDQSDAEPAYQVVLLRGPPVIAGTFRFA